MRVIAILICFATGTVLSLRHVVYACCFLIWRDIFRPIANAWWAIDFPAAHFVVATLLISIMVCKWHRRWNPIATVLCLMMAWMYICSFFAVHKDIAIEYTIYATKYLVPLIIISISLTTRWAQHMFLYTLAASIGLWSAQSGLHCLLQGSPEISMSIRGGQMSDRNDFIVGVLAALPLIGYVATAYSWKYRRAVRWLAMAVLGLSVAAVLFSLSRGGVVGLTALLLFYMVATGRFGKKLMIGGLLVVLALAFTPGFVVERMSTIDMDTQVQTEGSAAARLALLKSGMDITLDHPITGTGADTFRYIVMSYGSATPQDPHNIWIKAASEYGFPMLILFILTIWLMFRRLGRERRLAKARGDFETERMAIALSCSMVGFLSAATFTSIFLSEYFWAICALVGAFLAHQEARRKEAGHEVESEVVEPVAEPVTA